MYRLTAILLLGLLLASCGGQGEQTASEQAQTAPPTQSQSQSSDDVPEVQFENEEARAVFNKSYKLYMDWNNASKAGNTAQTEAITVELNQTIAEAKAMMGKLSEQDYQILNKFIFSIEGRIKKRDVRQ